MERSSPDGARQGSGGVECGDGQPWNYGSGGNPYDPRVSYTRQVDYVSAACLAIRLPLWQQLGGFSPAFAPAYFEDTDLAFAVQALQLRVRCAPLARVIHHEGTTCGIDTGNPEGSKRLQPEHAPLFRRKWQPAFQPSGAPSTAEAELQQDRGLVGPVLVIDHSPPPPTPDAGPPAAGPVTGHPAPAWRSGDPPPGPHPPSPHPDLAVTLADIRRALDLLLLQWRHAEARQVTGQRPGARMVVIVRNEQRERHAGIGGVQVVTAHEDARLARRQRRLGGARNFGALGNSVIGIGRWRRLGDQPHARMGHIRHARTGCRFRLG